MGTFSGTGSVSCPSSSSPAARPVVMRTLYFPGSAPCRPSLNVSTYLPAVSVRAAACRPFSGMKMTMASERGCPSSVTVPETLANSGPPPPQPAHASTTKQIPLKQETRDTRIGEVLHGSRPAAPSGMLCRWDTTQVELNSALDSEITDCQAIGH